MPLYYTEEGGEQFFAVINALCDAYERDRGLRISIHTRVLVSNTIVAIREDPSPAWLASEGNLSRIAQTELEALPRVLNDLAASEAIDGQLTYFQTLHWLTRHLDTLCPFDKKPRRSRGR